MRVLVFQHAVNENAGLIQEFLAADGASCDAIHVYAGQPIPSLRAYDALLVLGGVMDVWEEAAHPWLVPEKRAIREAVESHRLPMLGICLGHQLLADAMGGTVGLMTAPEIGVLTTAVTDAGRADPLFGALGPTFPALHWHGAEVTRVPPGATALAATAACGVQAMRVGDRAYGMQFHAEVSRTTLAEWATMPGYKKHVETAQGEGAFARLETAVLGGLDGINRASRQLYDRFKAMIGRR